MELIDKVMNGEVRYCPHGRPVSMELTKSQLDRSFKRA
jgi:DNA mismatch repair protein MutL